MKRLEEHKGFPFVAWALIIAFTLFTYHLTTQVAALESESASHKTEAAIDDIDAYFE